MYVDIHPAPHAPTGVAAARRVRRVYPTSSISSTHPHIHTSTHPHIHNTYTYTYTYVNRYTPNPTRSYGCRYKEECASGLPHIFHQLHTTTHRHIDTPLHIYTYIHTYTYTYVHRHTPNPTRTYGFRSQKEGTLRLPHIFHQLHTSSISSTHPHIHTSTPCIHIPTYIYVHRCTPNPPRTYERRSKTKERTLSHI